MCHGPNSTWCKMTKHWHEYAVHKSSTPNQRCIHPLEDLLRADGWRFPSWCLCCQELNSIRDFDCFDCFSSPQPHRNDANSIKLMNKPLEFGKHWNFTSKDLFFCNVSFRQNGTFSRPNKRLAIDTDLGLGYTCQLLAELRCIEEATLSDVLGKFVLPFMLVHVYMCTDPKLTRAHVAYSWHRWLGHGWLPGYHPIQNVWFLVRQCC